MKYDSTFKGKSNFIGNSHKQAHLSNNTITSKRNKGIRCKDCKDYGHIKVEYANTKNKPDKAMQVTWSNN